MAPPVRVETAGGVCRVTLDRPERLNALGEDVREGLHDAIRALADDTTVRVMVLAGAGRAFSAGADLKERVEPPTGWVARRHHAGRWQRLLDDLEALPQVTIARLHSHVIGGAVLLAAACDLRIAADDVAFAIPEVAIGIPLTWAGLPRLVREVGLPVTRDLVMTGRTMHAEEALARGLVQRVAPAAELDAATDALVDGLLAQPAGPLAMTRAALAAIGRAQPGAAAAWADPDLLAWSLADPEGRQSPGRRR